MSTNSKKRPCGWQARRISELCVLNPKHDRKLSGTTEVSFIPMANISETEGKILSHEVRPLSKVRKGYTHFAENDVIWAKITPCMENGKAAIARNLHNGIGCGSTEFYVLRTHGSVSPEFLFQYIRQEKFRIKAKQAMSGAVGHQRVPKDFLLDTTIPVPPFEEQHRIIKTVGLFQTKSNKAKKALETAKPLLNKLRQSILAAAFRGDLTADWRKKNPDVEPASILLERIRKERRKRWEETELAKMKAKGKEPKNDKWKDRYKEPEPVDTTDLPELPDGWNRTSTDQLFIFVTSGSRGWAKYYSGNGAIFLRIGNLNRKNIDLDLSKIQYVSPPNGAEGIRTQVKENDVLVSITADVGIISIVPPNLSKAYINQHISLARPVDTIQARYLALYLSSPDGQDQFQNLKRGVTKSGLGLNDIKAVIVPIPPYKEQKKIVEFIEKKYTSINFVESYMETCSQDLAKLDQSILAKAFRGELVPQDPTDEPASALLDRIKAEREAMKPKRKSTRKRKTKAVS